MFDNIQDAQQKLQHSVVLYQGIPVFVHAVLASRPDGVFRVYFKPIPLDLPVDFNNDPDVDNEEQGLPDPFAVNRGNVADLDRQLREDGCIRKKINSPHFNKFRPISLGYMNHFAEGITRPTFVVRSTDRQYSQGVSLRRLVFESPSLFRRQVDRLGDTVLLRSIAFKEMVANEYPSIQQAMDVILDETKTPTGVAVSREVAIMYQEDLGMNLVFVRNQLAGSILGKERDNWVVQVSPQRRHYKEILEGVGFVTRLAQV